jgi:SpoVK/Ycf46/Vps4 family AAA+-type ATPase
MECWIPRSAYNAMKCARYVRIDSTLVARAHCTDSSTSVVLLSNALCRAIQSCQQAKTEEHSSTLLLQQCTLKDNGDNNSNSGNILLHCLIEPIADSSLPIAKCVVVEHSPNLERLLLDRLSFLLDGAIVNLCYPFVSLDSLLGHTCSSQLKVVSVDCDCDVSIVRHRVTHFVYAKSQVRSVDNDDDLAARKAAILDAVLVNRMFVGYDHRVRQLIDSLATSSSVLVSGPSGVGKTQMARALVRALNAVGVPSSMVSAASLFSEAQGGTERALAQLFDWRRRGSQRQALRVLVVDSIELIAGAAGGRRVPLLERRCNALLARAMDALEHGHDRVTLVGIAADASRLPANIRRRFDVAPHVDLELPDVAQRRVILAAFAGAEQSATLQSIAERMPGFVGADIKQLVERALLSGGGDSEPPLALDAALARNPRPQSLLDRSRVAAAGGDEQLTFAAVAGLDAIVARLRATVVGPICSGSGARMRSWGLSAVGGVLLTGPPGCGKTLLARATVGEARANSIYVSGPELLSKIVGDSEQAIADVFRDAHRAAPCIVLFDQIEAIGRPRPSSSSSSSGAAADRLLSCLLTHLDGLASLEHGRHSSEAVVVVATTGAEHMLDAALLRAGRFDVRIEVPLPGRATRAAVLRQRIAKMPVRTDNVDALIDWLAERTQGLSSAALVQLCNEAALIALRANIDIAELERTHFASALDLLDGQRSLGVASSARQRQRPTSRRTMQRAMAGHSLRAATSTSRGSSSARPSRRQAIKR